MCADIFYKDHATNIAMFFVAACSVDGLKHDVGLFVTLSRYLLTVVALVLSNFDDIHEHKAKKATGKCISWCDPHVKG